MYQCLASDFDNRVEKKLQSVIRQVNKYGYSAEYKVVSREVKEVPVYREEGTIRTKCGTTLVEVVNYEFTMPDFKVGNYTPVAVIEHDVVENSNVANFVHIIGNFEAPAEWWTIKGHCDDCNDSYLRKKTVMLLNNEDGTYRQIGTSCLKKYLGITCFNVIHNYMSVEELIEEEMAVNIDYLPYQKQYVETKRLLACVYSMYDVMGGFVRNHTIEKAWDAAINSDTKISESCIERAENTIKYFDSLDVEELNSFARDVKAAVLTKYIGCSGYIAYAPELQNKLMIKAEQKTEAMKSEYVGNVKDKIVVDVTVIGCTGFESQYGYMFVNTFKTVDSDNIFVWITGTKSYEVGTKLTIMGTIKNHQEYRGVKQTVLTRVKEV